MKRIAERGNRLVLPIVGDIVSEVRVGLYTLPTLFFRADHGTESQIEVEDEITLTRGTAVQVLTGAKPGKSYRPQQLGPLVQLLESRVTEAIAEKTGELYLTFTTALVLSVIPTGDEAWHFQSPAPGTQRGAVGKHLSLHGAAGRLI